MSVTIVSSPKCNLHNMGDEHPEQPGRLHQINDQLIASGLEYVVHFANATPVSKETLALAHDKDFIQSIFDRAPKEDWERIWIDDDTIMMDKSLDAALYSAGAVVNAVDMVMAKETTSAFCAVRPPGHHAGHNTSSGFCIFNNVAVGAKYAMAQYGLKRIAIVDFDVHHGDGTQDIVKDDERIMFCSSFQHPFYPFTGDSAAREGIINVPIPAGTKGSEYRELVNHWFDAIDKFAPELIFVSAGFDAHAEDDLAHLRLVEEDYVWLTEQIKILSEKHCGGKIVSVLEGGYALSALARSAVAHIKTLAS
ncbi:histone deacetylase family protein [Glaciecola sp. 2405UD65-10]|uniref:histone deacetylase family protein n=1 Tax=Glaciecola sp. 2405UD65-10 TaxID=3397244 RepID=UPI003B5907F2